VFVPFSVLMSVGDVAGLEALRCDAGALTATRMLLSQLRPHGRRWWRHWRTGRQVRPAATDRTSVSAATAQSVTDGACVLLTAAETAEFTVWRKTRHPDVSPAALLATAVYEALAVEGAPVREDGFFTLIDLRRHLPEQQSRRPGNLAKSVYVPAVMSDPRDVAASLSAVVESARAVPALVSGAVVAGLRGRVYRGGLSEPAGTTLTFNSIMRNPGVERVPWTDPAQARYLLMSYPVAPGSISVAACKLAGRLLFSASFDAKVLDGAAVRRALERLRDVPALHASDARVGGAGPQRRVCGDGQAAVPSLP
jgi:hypothetical protein